MNNEYTLTVQESLTEMKNGKTVKSNRCAGWFILSGDEVFFSCVGEYPCCHDNYPINEFLDFHKDDKFKVDE
jgi:hypothetical protein